MKKIYSLGGGCWAFWHISEEYREESIFKANVSHNDQVFLPLELFNGNLENEFLHKDGNWDIIGVNNNWDYNEILKKQKEDEKYVSNYLVTYNLLNKNTGFLITHCASMKSNPANKYTFRTLFETFNRNKYNLLYLIDFQRCGYEKYRNSQLLEFEKFLLDNGYDLKNFMYLDVNSAKDKSRFDSCKIPIFIQDCEDEAGKINESWSDTKCFFARHMDYVMERLNDDREK